MSERDEPITVNGEAAGEAADADGPGPAENPSRPAPSKLRKLWREWARPFLVILLVLCTFRSAVADWNDVPTGSMKPTIVEGDRIFVNKLAYDLKVPFTTWRLIEWSRPQRGDVVVFFSPEDGTRLVKRVVGLPRDVVELRRNQLSINGEAADYEPLDPDIVAQIEADERAGLRFAAEIIDETPHPVMIRRTGAADQGPYVVPDDHFFLMGDNRDDSRDSRAIGFVPRKLIVGQATRVVISLDRDHHYAPRWDRFFRRLP